MAPQVSLADDIERLSLCLAQLARVALSGKLQLSQLGKPAAAAGLSAAEAAAWVRGEVSLPSRQSVALVSAVLEQQRAAQQNYMEVLRQGHAGGNAMGASYGGLEVEKVPGPRGRTMDRTWVRGGPLEVTSADVEATLTRLRKDFDGWAFEADGAPPKVTWHARHAEHGQASGATSAEVAEKVSRIVAQLAEDARKAEQYIRG